MLYVGSGLIELARMEPREHRMLLGVSRSVRGNHCQWQATYHGAEVLENSLFKPSLECFLERYPELSFRIPQRPGIPQAPSQVPFYSPVPLVQRAA
jgi:hypothetical protein